MQRFNALSGRGKAGVGCLSVFVLMFICGSCLNVFGGDDAPAPVADAPTVEAADDPTAEVEATGAPTDTPAPTPDLDAATAALAGELDELNTAAGGAFFVDALVKMDAPEHPRCVVTVDDAWYALPKFQKERILENIAGVCALRMASLGLRGPDPSEVNYPTTSFVDVAGKEVAYKSTLRTVIEEE